MVKYIGAHLLDIGHSGERQMQGSRVTRTIKLPKRAYASVEHLVHHLQADVSAAGRLFKKWRTCVAGIVGLCLAETAKQLFQRASVVCPAPFTIRVQWPTATWEGAVLGRQRHESHGTRIPRSADLLAM